MGFFPLSTEGSSVVGISFGPSKFLAKKPALPVAPSTKLAAYYSLTKPSTWESWLEVNFTFLLTPFFHRAGSFIWTFGSYFI